MNDLLAHPVLTAIGYAHLHSVWVFGLLIVAGQLTAKGLVTASRRHAVLMGILAALPLVFILLVYLGLPPQTDAAPAAGEGWNVYIQSVTGGGTAIPTQTGSYSWWLSLLSLAYLIGLLFAGGRTAGCAGWGGVPYCPNLSGERTIAACAAALPPAPRQNGGLRRRLTRC